MTSIDCRLISSQSPLRPLIVEPVQEGLYSIYHSVEKFYTIYQRCVLERSLPKETDLKNLAQGVCYLIAGIAMLVPLVNVVAFQMFVFTATSYEEALRDSVDQGNTDAVKQYLKLGVNPNNVRDTKALIYRSRKREIIEALIQAGADLSRNYRETRFLERLVSIGMEGLATEHFDPSYLDTNTYLGALERKNWAFVAFLVRNGVDPSVRIHNGDISARTINPLELPVVCGDHQALIILYRSHGDKIKNWADQLKDDFPRMKVNWIWSSILVSYLKTSERVSDKKILALFENGATSESFEKMQGSHQNLLQQLLLHRLEPFVVQLVQKKLIDIGPYLKDVKLNALDDNVYASFLIRMGHRGCDVSGVGYIPASGNLLEGIVATQNVERLEAFARSRTFEEFYGVYLDLKKAYPNIYTGWMWNVLYEIPPQHFEQFTPIQQQEAITRSPDRVYPYSDLLSLFDRINFDDPSQPDYVGEGARRETLNTMKPVVYTPKEIRKGLSNILQAIGKGYHTYRLMSQETQGYALQVQWIIHYLKQEESPRVKESGFVGSVLSYFKKREPLPRTKANVLVDMGKSCLMCPGRYNDIFDIAIRRLKNEEVSVVSFEDQVQRHFGDLRSKMLTHIAFKYAHGCTHAWENLIFHLHAERGLSKRRPERIFTSQDFSPGEPEVYKFIFKSDAKEAFDAEYTPEEMMGVLSEFARIDKKRTQEENDFNELMMESMVNGFSARFSAIQELERRMKVRVTEKMLVEDQVLSIDVVEKDFRRIDSTYTIPRDEESQTWTFGYHFINFKRAIFLPFIRPLDYENYGYVLSEVIHPLVMGEVLCGLGHLRQRITFAPNALSGHPGVGVSQRGSEGHLSSESLSLRHLVNCARL